MNPTAISLLCRACCVLPLRDLAIWIVIVLKFVERLFFITPLIASNGRSKVFSGCAVGVSEQLCFVRVFRVAVVLKVFTRLALLYEKFTLKCVQYVKFGFDLRILY
jgi:hypothetical protein